MLKTLIANLVIGSTALLAFNASAANTYFEARNDAMGGVGVASSNYGVASLANPALLARHSGINFFSLLFPNAGVSLTGKLDGTNNANMDVTFGSSSVFAMPIDFLSLDLLSVAVMMKGYGEGSYTGNVKFNDIKTILDNTSVIENSNIRGKTAFVTEAGVSIARSFDILGTKIGIGVTPKYQCIQAWNATISQNNSGSSNNTTNSNVAHARDCNNQNAFNADVGAYADVLGLVTVGVAMQNVIPREVTTEKQGDLDTETYQIRSQVTAGAALNYKLVNLALDVDITPTSGFKSDAQRQYASIGAELNVLFAQIRAGYRYNLLSESNINLTKDINAIQQNRDAILKGNKIISAGVGIPGFDLTYSYDQDSHAQGITAQFIIGF